jgi:hypothetical protein
MGDAREPAVRVPAGHLVVQLLGVAAGAVLGPDASDAEVADWLGELLRAVSLYGGLGRGVVPVSRMPERSAAMAAFEVLVAEAGCRFRAKADATSPTSPTALPAGLAIPAGVVGPDLQPGALSVSDKIPLAGAALLLGVSSEWVRRLIGLGEIAGWQEAGGRRRWHVSRASAIAYRERRDGWDGPGGTTRRSA